MLNQTASIEVSRCHNGMCVSPDPGEPRLLYDV
jgi:hypothetical protein